MEPTTGRSATTTGRPVGRSVRPAVLLALTMAVTACGGSSVDALPAGEAGVDGSITPDRLAAATHDVPPEDGPGPGSLPPVSFDAIEAVLDEFGSCLNVEGADVRLRSFEDIIGMLPDLPVDADRATMFAYFYDRDIADPETAGAFLACIDVLDDPAISMFVPDR